MRKTLMVLIIATAISSICGYNTGLAQSCCGRITLPDGGIRQRPLLEGQYEIMIWYEYSKLDRTLLGDVQIDDPLGRWNRTQSLNLASSYGISDRYSTTIVIPIRWTRLSILDDRVIRRSSGLGDIVGMIKYRFLAPISLRKPEIAFGLGLKLPTGNFAYADTFGTLSVGQQVGTGAVDLILAAQYIQGIYRFIIYGDISLRIPAENKKGYRFGNELRSAIKITAPLFSDNILPVIGFESRMSARDNFDGDITDPYGGGAFRDSGGKWINLAVGANFLLNRSFSIRLESNVPLYSKVNGRQLSESAILRVGIAYASL